jgi:hypothetical protein
MKSYRILVRTASGLSSQGTGWLIGRRTVCTAFHVVGHCGERKWMHQYVEGATYWMNSDDGELQLTPIVYDAVGDAALLSCEADAGVPYPLAEQSRIRVPWSAAGYPGFHGGGLFTFSGSVVALHDYHSNRAMELQVAQGTDVLWDGMSGAPVLDEDSVTGLVTNVTNAVSTAWAVPVAALKRLDELRTFVTEATNLWVDTPMAATARMLRQSDEQTIGQLLETLRLEQPDDQRVQTLQASFKRVTAAPPPPVLSLELLTALRETYGVLPVQKGARRIRPMAARQFSDIFRKNTHFGGRLTELRKLDTFVAEVPSGYFFVTGTSGYGKTSLLAHWIEALRRRGDTVVFHFFSPRMPETLEPKEALGRLAEQLMAVHDLGGVLRRDRVRLQSLYVDLLQAPAPGGRPLIIVLDALDEVIKRIRPGPALFPETLGAGIRVVFSARSMAAKDWLADLRLKLPVSQTLRLGQMGQDDIKDVVTRAGLDASSAMVTTLLQKTAGDPFYVSDVVRVLADGGTLKTVEALPKTHSAYLHAWWDDALERVQDPGFVDLMGTLAALKAPLAPKELVAVSKDRLESARIGLLLKNAARYVDGDSVYWLRHDRIRQFVRDIIGDAMATYQDRVIAFANRWNDKSATDAARAYGRRHAIQHLLEVDRFAEALAVVNSEFIAAGWREDGSYAPLIANLDAMVEWAQDHPDEKTAIVYAPALVVMRETVRDLMRHLNPELLRAWTHLDAPASLKELLESLPSHRGEACQPLLAVAEELLEGKPPGQSSPADRAWATELLGRVIGLLPLVRTAAWTQEAWARVCRLLAGSSLDSALVHPLLQQGAAFIEHIGADSPELKAACLADLAAASLHTNPSEARRWLDQTEAVAAELGAGDQAFVVAIAMPVYRALAVAQLEQKVESLIHAHAANPEDSTFSRLPLKTLIEAWAPEPDVIRRVLSSGVDMSLAAPALLKLGLEEEAWRSIDDAAVRNRSDAMELLRRCFESAPQHRVEIRRRLQSLLPVTDDVSPLMFAIAGRWSDVLAALDRRPSAFGHVLPDCIERALEDLRGEERGRVLDGLASRLNILSAEHGAQPAAKIALLLARAGDARARTMLDKAWQFEFGHLPSGDADDLRRIAAVALAADGAIDRASAVALGCRWLSQRVTALCSMISVTADALTRLRIAGQIEAAVDQADVNDLRTFLDESLSTICSTVREIRSRDVETAATLARLVARGIALQPLQSYWPLISDYLSIGELVEPDTHAQRLREMAAMMQTASAAIGGRDLLSLFRAAVYVVERGIGPGDLLESLLDRLTQPSEKLVPHVMGAAAAALSRRDHEWALRLFDEALAALPSVAVVPAATSGVGKYIHRLSGDLAFGVGYEAHAITTPAIFVAVSIIAAANALDRVVLERLLGKVGNCVHDENLTGTQRARAVEGLLNTFATLPSTHADIVQRLTSALWSDVEAVRGSVDADGLFARAAFTLGRHGHLRAAQTVAALIQDRASRERAEYQIDLLTFRVSLVDLSPVERAFFDTDVDQGLATVIVKMIREGQTTRALSEVIALLRDGRVRTDLVRDSLAHMPAVYARWGAEGTEQVILAIQDFDRRVLDAAHRVGGA